MIQTFLAPPSSFSTLLRRWNLSTVMRRMNRSEAVPKVMTRVPR